MSGGQYLNLAGLSADQAAASVSPFSLISIDADPKEVADIYPRLPQPVEGRVTIAGRLLARTATLTLNYGRDGVVSQHVPITISQDGASEMNLVSRYWAQLKLADLSANVDRNEAEITALGKQFNLVTPYTSMIVLESVDQYLRHKIVPPRSRGEIYSQFMQQIEQQQAVAQTEEKAKIDRVVTMWQSRLAWWNQEFKYAADFKYVAPPQPKPAAGATAALADSEVTAAGTRVTTIRQSGSQAASGGRGGGGGFGSSAGGVAAERGSAQGQPDSSPAGAAPATPAPAVVNSPTPNQTVATHDLYARTEHFSEDGTRLRARREDGEVAGRGVRSALFTLGVNDPAKADVNSDAITEASISLKAWSPDTPYLKALRAAPADKAYDVYLKERNTYKSSPAFYLDCADFFAKTHPDLALRILTNIPELALDDGRLLRIAAHRLQQLDQLDLAIDLFERIVKLRPEEPQSFRDLALALGDRADALMARHDADRARSDYQRSLDLLHKVVMNHWDRFDEIELIALTEANRLLVRAKSASGNSTSAISNPFDPRLIRLLDPDLRIVMTWDTDNTDIDLHVTEPSGETCVYNHNRTTIGGALSKDFTQGYGPEEYLLRKLMPGQYKIQAHFYGNRDQRVVGPTTVQATVITHYGRSDESRQSLTLRLKDAKDMVDVGTVTLK
jgi:tetratricopeptide (TPR) repeat protein